MAEIQNTGFKLATTVVSNGAVTGNEWSDSSNLLLVDGDLSESNPSAGAASDVIIGGFNHNLDQDAVVVGIEIKLIGKRGAQTSPVITLTPYAVDNTSGVNAYYPYQTPFAGLTESIAEYILGTPTYLFATAWTPDMINNFKLQLMANGDVYMDAALVNVYYYIPDAPETPAAVGTHCEDCNSQIQAQPFYLALPFLANETKCYLQSFNYPDGTPIQYADLGSCGGYVDLVFDEGKPKGQGTNFEENAKTAVWSVLANGTVEIDFVSLTNRALMFKEPYTHDADLLSDHDANSKVIISNNAPFYDRFLKKCHLGVLVSEPIEVLDEDVSVADPVTKFNFKGSGVLAQVDGIDPEQVNITIPGAGGTTPATVVSATSATSGSTLVDTLDATLNVSGVNRGASVQVSTQQTVTVTSVTVGGVAATQEETATDVTGNLRSEVWVCVNPPLGNQTVVVNLSAPAYLSFGAESLAGIDTATPVGATQSATGNSTGPTLSLNTVYDNSIILDSLTTAMTPILYTPGAGQAENWSETANTDTRQGGSSVESAGLAPDAVTMAWTITQSTRWALAAVEIKGITSGGSGDQSGIQFEDEGVDLGLPGTVDEVDFVGDGVTATRVGNKVTVTIPGTGSSGGGGSAKLEVDTTQVVVPASTTQDVYTVPIPGGTLGTNDGLKYKIMLAAFVNASQDFQINIYYGGTLISQLANGDVPTGNAEGYIEGFILAAGATNAQKGNGAAVIELTTGGAAYEPVALANYDTAAVDSTVSQDLVIEAVTGVGDSLTFEGILVESIAPGSGSGGSGTAIEDTITQTAHGFAVDEVIRSSGVDAEYTQSQADSVANAEVVGIVSSVPTANTFTIVTEGWTTLTALPVGATAGDTLWLSDATPGLLTLTEPTAAGSVSKPVGTVIDAATKLVYIHNYRGVEVPSGAAGIGETNRSTGVDTRLISQASGNQVIAHGLGEIPTYVRISAMVQKNQPGASLANSIGSYDGTTNRCVWEQWEQGSSNTRTAGSNATEIIHIDGEQTATITVDETNITIAWVKGGTATASDIQFLWEAIGTTSIIDPVAGKKVGVGAATDIDFFNIQYPFVENGATVDAMWAISGACRNWSLVTLDAGERGINNQLTDYDSLLPNLDSAPDRTLKFNSGKLLIVQLTVRTGNSTVNECLGGVGFWGGTDIRTVQGSNGQSVGFVRKDSDGQWYTRSGVGGGFTENPLSLAADTKYVLRIEYDPGNATPQTRFFVNGELVDTITTNVPSADASIISFSCGNGAGVNDYAIRAMTCPSFAVEN